MLIRPGGARDAAAVATLHTASWRGAYAGILPAAYLAGPVEDAHVATWRERLVEPVSPGLFVAEEAGGLFGFVFLRAVGERVLLDNLHARPDARGRGIGTALVEAGLNWAGGVFPDRPVYLEVLTDNTAAIAFYERRGWHRTGSGTVTFTTGVEVPNYEYTAPTAVEPGPDPAGLSSITIAAGVAGVTDPELR